MIQKTTESPTESPIEEIHRTRREISDRFGGDIDAIAEDAARRQAASGRPLWQPNTTIKESPSSGAVERVGNGKSLVAAEVVEKVLGTKAG